MEAHPASATAPFFRATSHPVQPIARLPLGMTLMPSSVTLKSGRPLHRWWIRMRLQRGAARRDGRDGAAALIEPQARQHRVVERRALYLAHEVS